MNPASASIHDFLHQPMRTESSAAGQRWSLPGVWEPWLRRYGESEVIRLRPGEQIPARLRARADEVWAILEGSIVFRASDQRADSPSQGGALTLRIGEPTLLLVPFGVRAELSCAEGPALLVRMATHTSEEDPLMAAPE